jgi:hypothetical protein
LALAINDSSYPIKKSGPVVDWAFFLRGGVMSTV